MEHIAINKKSWNDKVDVHVASEFYNHKTFLAGRNSLNKIELELLGDVTNKKILHLQCHFGQDSLSLARMGAHVTGVDFSEKAIAKAKETAAELDLDSRFICCNINDLPNHLHETFDLVFASYGVIGWHPDLEKWTSLVAQFVKPGGEYMLAEFHPAVWMYADDFSHVQYSYFNKETIAEEETGSYAEKDAAITNKFMMWNHSLADSIQPLITKGFSIVSFNEYDYSPYSFVDQCVKTEKGYYIKGFEGKLPLVFSLVARKRTLKSD